MGLLVAVFVVLLFCCFVVFLMSVWKRKKKEKEKERAKEEKRRKEEKREKRERKECLRGIRESDIPSPSRRRRTSI